MKRLLVLVMATLLLVACGNDEPTIEKLIVEDEIEQKEIEREIIGEKEHNITLLDNDDLKIILLTSIHERLYDYEDKDILFLNLEVENKQNRTFRYSLDEISIDGRSESYDIGMTETDVGPEEKITMRANFSVEILNENKTFTFDEHLSGRITYSDYDGFREQTYFSEYINE